MYASQNGHFEIVKYLVEQGADVNLDYERNKTALDVAKTAEIRNFLYKVGGRHSENRYVSFEADNRSRTYFGI